MDVINPSIQNRAIKELFRLNHIVSLFLLITGIPLFWFTPFVSKSKLARDFSVVYGICSSVAVLLISRSLSRDQQLILAIEKQEQAQMRHAIATSAYLAEQTNVAIAMSLLEARQDSLQPVYEVQPVEPPQTQGFNELSKLQEVAEVASNSPQFDRLKKLVTNELGKGTNRSVIIKKYLIKEAGSYLLGKALLGQIESEINWEKNNDES